MDGREYLEVGRTKSTRRRWAWVAVPVVVALATLGVVRTGQLQADHRLGQQGPSPVPQVSSTPPARSSAVVPPNGTLLVAAAGKVAAVDLGSGTSRSTSVEFDAKRGSIATVQDGVVIYPGGPTKTQILVAGAYALFPTPPAFASANTFVAGTDTSVWAARVKDPGERTTWRLLDLGGRVEAEVRATASVISDGAGGLIEVDGRSLRQAYPEPAGPRRDGTILAAGPDGHILRPCGDPGCGDALDLYTRTTRSYSKLDFELPEDVTTGALSSYNRLAALTENDGEQFRVEIRSMSDGQVLRSFPQTGSSAAVWLNQRWVALVSDDRLVLYDTVSDSVVTPAPNLTGLGPLAWQPA